MPVNAPAEYFAAEEKFRNAKTKEERILALEEMIRFLPRHHGSENLHAQLKSRLAKLKREIETKKKTHRKGIVKEGEAQVCLIGFTKSGKSLLLSRLTSAKPKISEHPYTTTKPEIGMMDYYGIKIQLIEIPSTFEAEYLSIARTCDIICIIAKNEEERKNLMKMLEENFIKANYIFINPDSDIDFIKEKIWRSLELMIVYTGKRKLSPMALPIGSTVKDFASKIHKDFIKDFKFAKLIRKSTDAKGVERFRVMQVGLNYKLQDGDVLELHMK